MKRLIFLLIIFPLLNAFNYAEPVKVWAVGKESKISILGSSNVNTFAFDVKQYSGKDTLIASLKGKQAIVFRKGVLRLAVDDFKNGNPMLTRDFKKIIKAKNHPDIILNFKNLSAVPEQGVQNQRVNAEVEIVLAGRSKVFQFPLLACRVGNTLYVRGNEQVAFTDFGLQAPDKIMGFITVKNELNVKFELALKVVAEG